MKHHTEVFTCSSCGKVEEVPESYLRGLIARNRELVLEAMRYGPMPEPTRGSLHFQQGERGPNGEPPPLYVTRRG